MPPSPRRADEDEEAEDGFVDEDDRTFGERFADRRAAVARGVRRLVVTLLVVAVVAVGGGAYAAHRLQGNITAEDISAVLGDDRPAVAPADPTTGDAPVNVLVLGSDTRDLADGTGDAYGGVTADPGARSDTTVLVHLAADRRSATLVSIPRDSLVELPACTSTDGAVHAGGTAQFNSAFAVGGAGCAVKTVEALTGVRVDHYAVVDFSGFRSVVDALGGVEVCTPVAIDDPAADLRLAAGRQVLDGEQALGYARVRHGIGDGSDLGRIDRQQALMAALVRRATSTGVLLNPTRLLPFLDAVTTSTTTDPDLTDVVRVAEIARGLDAVPTDAVRFVTVPNEPAPEDPDRVRWTSAADDLWRAVRTDAPPAADPAAVPATAPADVSVSVLNAGAPAGTAATAAAALAAQGFVVTATGNAAGPRSGVAVRHGAGAEGAAATASTAFAGSVVVADDALAAGEVVVEIGAGAPAVSPVPATTGDAAAGVTEELTARTADDDPCA